MKVLNMKNGVWSDSPGPDPTDAAMIKRDEPGSAPVVQAEDPLAAVRSILQRIVDEPARTLRASLVGVVLHEMRKLLAPQVSQEPAQAPIDTAAGLTVEHVPGDRWSIR
jgi:hypothetical protein